MPNCQTQRPRLHLPLQAGSDAVLKSMRRRLRQQNLLQLVEALRAARPDIALSTDLIVGFPGETEEDFQATLDMMRACDFMSSFVHLFGQARRKSRSFS